LKVVEELVVKRKALREAKEWDAADRIKRQLKELGVTLVDQDTTGPGWFAGAKGKAKRAAIGVCFNFQKGECERGATCRFAHVLAETSTKEVDA
jgi:hypothetical protein